MSYQSGGHGSNLPYNASRSSAGNSAVTSATSSSTAPSTNYSRIRGNRYANAAAAAAASSSVSNPTSTSRENNSSVSGLRPVSAGIKSTSVNSTNYSGDSSVSNSNTSSTARTNDHGQGTSSIADRPILITASSSTLTNPQAARIPTTGTASNISVAEAANTTSSEPPNSTSTTNIWSQRQRQLQQQRLEQEKLKQQQQHLPQRHPQQSHAQPSFYKQQVNRPQIMPPVNDPENPPKQRLTHQHPGLLAMRQRRQQQQFQPQQPSTGEARPATDLSHTSQVHDRVQITPQAASPPHQPQPTASIHYERSTTDNIPTSWEDLNDDDDDTLASVAPQPAITAASSSQSLTTVAPPSQEQKHAAPVRAATVTIAETSVSSTGRKAVHRLVRTSAAQHHSQPQAQPQPQPQPQPQSQLQPQSQSQFQHQHESQHQQSQQPRTLHKEQIQEQSKQQQKPKDFGSRPEESQLQTSAQSKQLDTLQKQPEVTQIGLAQQFQLEATQIEAMASKGVGTWQAKGFEELSASSELPQSHSIQAEQSATTKSDSKAMHPDFSHLIANPFSPESNTGSITDTERSIIYASSLSTAIDDPLRDDLAAFRSALSSLRRPMQPSPPNLPAVSRLAVSGSDANPDVGGTTDPSRSVANLSNSFSDLRLLDTPSGLGDIRLGMHPTTTNLATGVGPLGDWGLSSLSSVLAEAAIASSQHDGAEASQSHAFSSYDVNVSARSLPKHRIPGSPAAAAAAMAEVAIAHSSKFIMGQSITSSVSERSSTTSSAASTVQSTVLSESNPEPLHKSSIHSGLMSSQSGTDNSLRQQLEDFPSQNNAYVAAFTTSIFAQTPRHAVEFGGDNAPTIEPTNPITSASHGGPRISAPSRLVHGATPDSTANLPEHTNSTTTNMSSPSVLAATLGAAPFIPSHLIPSKHLPSFGVPADLPRPLPQPHPYSQVIPPAQSHHQVFAPSQRIPPLPVALHGHQHQHLPSMGMIPGFDPSVSDVYDEDYAEEEDGYEPDGHEEDVGGIEDGLVGGGMNVSMYYHPNAPQGMIPGAGYEEDMDGMLGDDPTAVDDDNNDEELLAVQEGEDTDAEGVNFGAMQSHYYGEEDEYGVYAPPVPGMGHVMPPSVHGAPLPYPLNPAAHPGIAENNIPRMVRHGMPPPHQNFPLLHPGMLSSVDQMPTPNPHNFNQLRNQGMLNPMNGGPAARLPLGFNGVLPHLTGGSQQESGFEQTEDFTPDPMSMPYMPPPGDYQDFDQPPSYANQMPGYDDNGWSPDDVGGHPNMLAHQQMMMMRHHQMHMQQQIEDEDYDQDVNGDIQTDPTVTDGPLTTGFNYPSAYPNHFNGQIPPMQVGEGLPFQNEFEQLNLKGRNSAGQPYNSEPGFDPRLGLSRPRVNSRDYPMHNKPNPHASSESILHPSMVRAEGKAPLGLNTLPTFAMNSQNDEDDKVRNTNNSARVRGSNQRTDNKHTSLPLNPGVLHVNGPTGAITPVAPSLGTNPSVPLLALNSIPPNLPTFTGAPLTPTSLAASMNPSKSQSASPTSATTHQRSHANGNVATSRMPANPGGVLPEPEQANNGLDGLQASSRSGTGRSLWPPHAQPHIPQAPQRFSQSDSNTSFLPSNPSYSNPSSSPSAQPQAQNQPLQPSSQQPPAIPANLQQVPVRPGTSSAAAHAQADSAQASQHHLRHSHRQKQLRHQSAHPNQSLQVSSQIQASSQPQAPQYPQPPQAPQLPTQPPSARHVVNQQVSASPGDAPLPQRSLPATANMSPNTAARFRPRKPQPGDNVPGLRAHSLSNTLSAHANNGFRTNPTDGNPSQSTPTLPQSASASAVASTLPHSTTNNQVGVAGRGNDIPRAPSNRHHSGRGGSSHGRAGAHSQVSTSVNSHSDGNTHSETSITPSAQGSTNSGRTNASGRGRHNSRSTNHLGQGHSSATTQYTSHTVPPTKH